METDIYVYVSVDYYAALVNKLVLFLKADRKPNGLNIG